MSFSRKVKILPQSSDWIKSTLSLTLSSLGGTKHNFHIIFAECFSRTQSNFLTFPNKILSSPTYLNQQCWVCIVATATVYFQVCFCHVTISNTFWKSNMAAITFLFVCNFLDFFQKIDLLNM